jgi:hypothetical protein
MPVRVLCPLGYYARQGIDNQNGQKKQCLSRLWSTIGNQNPIKRRTGLSLEDFSEINKSGLEY